MGHPSKLSVTGIDVLFCGSGGSTGNSSTGGGTDPGTQKVGCAGNTVRVSDNVKIQADQNGRITGVALQLTGQANYLGTAGGSFFNIPANTSVGVSLAPNGALNIGVNNPVFLKPGGPGAFLGAYLSSATFSNGSFSQVNGAIALESMPLGSTTTSSTFLRNQLNQNSQAVSLASILQSAAQLAQSLLGCSIVTGR